MEGRSRGRLIAIVAAVLVVAVVLGIAAAFGLKDLAAGRAGSPTPVPPTPAPTAEPTTGPTTEPPPATPGTPAPNPPSTPEPSDPGVPAAWQAAATRTAASTRRVVAITCSGTGIGTGYAAGPDTLVTSWRVVSGARTVALVDGPRLVPVEVVKSDVAGDLAVLRTSGGIPLGLPSLPLGTKQLASGDEVMVAGRSTQGDPVRARQTVQVGRIGEVGVEVTSPEGRHRVARMEGGFDAGLAGAPVVASDGSLVGMTVQTGPDQRELLVAGLDAVVDPIIGPSGQPLPPENCGTPRGPSTPVVVEGNAGEAGTVVGQYLLELNKASFDSAYALLGGNAQATSNPDKLSSAHAGTFSTLVNARTAPGGLSIQLTRLGGPTGCSRAEIAAAVAEGKVTRWEQGPAVGCG